MAYHKTNLQNDGRVRLLNHDIAIYQWSYLVCACRLQHATQSSAAAALTKNKQRIKTYI